MVYGTIHTSIYQVAGTPEYNTATAQEKRHVANRM